MNKSIMLASAMLLALPAAPLWAQDHQGHVRTRPRPLHHRRSLRTTIMALMALMPITPVKLTHRLRNMPARSSAD